MKLFLVDWILVPLPGFVRGVALQQHDIELFLRVTCFGVQ
jgi:hypothetical protein